MGKIIYKKFDAGGTEIYKKIDDSGTELMKKVWNGTPWIIDVFTDCVNSNRHRKIVEWCRTNFGNEASPIHGKEGNWQRGGVVIYGYTWLGFSTKEMMEKFIKKWMA